MTWLSRIAIAWLLVTCVASPQEIHVAAAADLSSALPEIAHAFEKQTRCRVIVSYGSSGNFYQQLLNGAPFDVFLSADIQYPQKLQDAGQTVPGSLTQYASGKLVLWARKESHIPLSSGIEALGSASVKKVAIANPQHAPYGKAAVAAMQSEKLYELLLPKLVYGENVAQAAAFVQSGSADAGIIPLSLALTPAMQSAGSYVEIPIGEYPTLHQAGVIIKSSPNRNSATQFIKFLQGTEATTILQRFGFATR